MCCVHISHLLCSCILALKGWHLEKYIVLTVDLNLRQNDYELSGATYNLNSTSREMYDPTWASSDKHMAGNDTRVLLPW